MSKLKQVLEEITKKGYTIDENGVVKNPDGEEIKGSIYEGYQKFSVRTETNSSFAVKHHRFQAYLKYGDSIFEKGMVVRHLNGNSLDNSYDNIVLGTQSQNMMDRTPEARKNHSQKSYITEDIGDEIIEDRVKGMSHRKLSVKYNIPKSTIQDFLKKSL
jgi:hypothetical protein